MSILNPRRHMMAAHVPGASSPLPAPAPAAPPPPARRAPPGWRVEGNAGCAVLLHPDATRAQLLEIRGHIDAALAKLGDAT